MNLHANLLLKHSPSSDLLGTDRSVAVEVAEEAVEGEVEELAEAMDLTCVANVNLIGIAAAIDRKLFQFL